MAYLALALRLTLVGVCLAALLGKLRGATAWREFRFTLRDVGVPDRLQFVVAVAIVVAEAGVVALAPWPDTGFVGAVVATALFVALTVGVVHAVRRGSVARCHCFGARGTRLSAVHIARNATLIVAAVAAIATSGLATSGLATSARAGSPSWQPAGIAVAIVAAAFACAVIVFWEDLATLLAPARSRHSPAPTSRPPAHVKGQQ